MSSAKQLKNYILEIPYSMLAPIALLMGLSPFRPEPHLTEKLRMLFAGTLVRPIDIFDLLMHSAPLLLLLVKFLLSIQQGKQSGAE